MHLRALLPGTVIVALMIVWAAHDGGYDADTWYWGALLSLSMLVCALLVRGGHQRMARAGVTALVCFALYVAWSYLSITWAQSPGIALEGSNRALLYLLIFAVMLLLPWTPEAALAALLGFALGVGTIAIVLLVRLASADLITGGRLSAPTGYFNATAALFTMQALVATVLASRRELPAAVRGLLLAFAAAGLQLALTAQSRGWLFTLPLILVIAICIVPDRLRVAAAALIPAAAVIASLRLLLHLYQSASGAGLSDASRSAGHVALLSCAAAFVTGTLLAWGEKRIDVPSGTRAHRRLIGTAVTVLVIAAVSIAGVRATHGHPFRFIERQWHGFSHPQSTVSTSSHFVDVGSGRFDFWRVALDAVLAHPIGGLGQDNFADYYVKRRHTRDEPQWTHSLELRLLAHTGFVGFALFVAFLIAAAVAAMRARRRDGVLVRAVVAAAVLPALVWLIHGSVDWFWEIPALSGPALGFLGLAGALSPSPEAVPSPSRRREQRRVTIRSRVAAPVVVAGATVAFVAAVIVLAFPYMSVREVSSASDVRASDPAAALRDLSRAARLNPLSPDPGRLAGVIALQTGQYATAEQRFGQSIAQEPGGWLAWLGAGLAESALGDSGQAHHDFRVAVSINSEQPVIQQALASVYSREPLTPNAALGMLASTLG